jgi:hypothetical protein
MSNTLYLKFKFSPDVKCSTTELLILWDLAQLADANNIVYPSMTTMAKWYQLSESATRRAVHSLIKKGHLEVAGNDKGGAGSRRYRLIEPAKYDAKALTPSVHDTPTPSVDATPNEVGTPSVDATPPLAYTRVTPSVGASQVVKRSKGVVINTSALCLDETLPPLTETAKASKAPITAEPSVESKTAEHPKRVRQGGSKRKSLPESLIAEDWKISDKLREQVKKIRPDLPDSKIDELREKMIENHHAHGRKYADHNATFKTWCRNDLKWNGAYVNPYDGFSPISTLRNSRDPVY